MRLEPTNVQQIGDELAVALALVVPQLTVRNDREAISWCNGRVEGAAAKQDAAQLRPLAAQAEIQVATGGAGQVADLAVHPQVPQQRVRLEEVVDVARDLVDLEQLHPGPRAIWPTQRT